MIIFLYGKDTYRSRQKLLELKNKFLNEIDKDATSLVILNAEQTSIDEINRNIASSSLFVKKRMVVLENIFKNKSKVFLDEVFGYFKKRQDDDNVIVFWDETNVSKLKTNKLFKFLCTKEFVQEFKEFTNQELIFWINEIVKKEGAKINHQAVLHLSGLFGADLWALTNEIRKIIHFKKAKQDELIKDSGVLEIVVADVEKLCRGRVDENIFALTDAISQKRKALAIELLEKEFEAGVAETYLLFMIERQFKILLQVRQALDSGLTQKNIISDLKLHPFVAQKSIGQVRNFSLEFLTRLFSHLVKIDRDMKTGKLDLRTAVGLVIAKI